MIDVETIFDSDREEYEFMKEKKEKTIKEQIVEMAIEEMSRFITCVDIETEPEGTCCRMNFEQADTMACALYNANYRKQKEGEWQELDICAEDMYCSVCGGIAPVDCEKEAFYKSNFCPNCGAKMKGGAE